MDSVQVEHQVLIHELDWALVLALLVGGGLLAVLIMAACVAGTLWVLRKK